MSRTARATVLVTLTGAAALASTAVVAPVSAHEDGGLRAATAIASKYASEQRAIDAGFLRTDDCVELPFGYMGYHYTYPSRIDGRLQPGQPEVVLYKDGADGNRVLTGIEYIVVAEDQHLPYSDHDRPTLWGHEFQGPMAGHGPGMPVHYDLHVWTHDDNPNGAWTPANTSSDLACP